MEETIQNIIDKSPIPDTTKFSELLNNSIHRSADKDMYGEYENDNITFHIESFFKGLNTLLNKADKKKRLLAGVKVVEVVFYEIGFEIEKEDAFLLYHIRNLGKFKMKEQKLKEELTPLWSENKDYAIPDSEFSHTLKSLMRMGIINLRKGTLSLKRTMEVRYRKNK